MSFTRKLRSFAFAATAILWLAACALYSAPWYFAVGPLLIIAWFSTKIDAWYDAVAESKAAIKEQTIQLKLLLERVSSIEESLKCNESQLDDLSERLVHLLDQQLYAQRMRGEVPWPNGKVEQRSNNS